MGMLCRLASLVTLSHVALATDLTIDGLDLPELTLPELVLPELVLPDLSSKSLFRGLESAHVTGDLGSESPPDEPRDLLLEGSQAEVKAQPDRQIDQQRDDVRGESQIYEQFEPLRLDHRHEESEVRAPPVSQVGAVEIQFEENANSAPQGLYEQPPFETPSGRRIPDPPPAKLEFQAEAPPPEANTGLQPEVMPQFEATHGEPNVGRKPENIQQSEGLRACSAHPQCSHLAGNCCPSRTGQFLDCCEGEAADHVADQFGAVDHFVDKFQEAPLSVEGQFLESPPEPATYIPEVQPPVEAQFFGGPPMPTTYTPEVERPPQQTEQLTRFLVPPPPLTSGNPVYEQPHYEQPHYVPYGEPPPQFQQPHFQQPRVETSLDEVYYDQANPLGVKLPSFESRPNAMSQHVGANDAFFANWR